MRRRRRRRGQGATLALLALALLALVVALLGSPRHRAFYFGGGEVPRGEGLARSTFRLSPPRHFVGAADTLEVSPTAAVDPGHTVPLPDAQGRVTISIADRVPFRLPAEGVPAGWALKEFAGRAVVELTRSDAGLALRLRSAQASFALYRDALVDLGEHPVLSWRWKVAKLPPRGDVRGAGTDDEAAQVYVVFPRWPSPLSRSDVIGYVWDTRAPVGTRLTSPRAANVRIVVVESGTSRLDEWQRESRNVAEDYATLFGRRPPRVGQVALMIDSNDTRADAEAFFADLVFSGPRAESSEKPTSMLR